MMQTISPPDERVPDPLSHLAAGENCGVGSDGGVVTEAGENLGSMRECGAFGAAAFAIAALPAWKMAELAPSADLGVTTAIVFGGAAWHLWRCVPPRRGTQAMAVVAAWVGLTLTAWQLPWVEAGDYWFVRTAIALGGVAMAGLWSGVLRGWRAAAAVSSWAVWLHVAEPMERALSGSWIRVPTANVAGWLLWQGGQDVAVSGTVMRTTAGVVEVGGPCTGVPLASLLLALLAIAGLLLRMRWTAMLRIGLTVSALAFSIAAVRVAVLAMIVNDPVQFEYWHSAAGAGWFSALGIVVLAGLIYRAVSPAERASRSSAEPLQVPKALRHVVWPMGAVAAAAFFVDGGKSPVGLKEKFPAPVVAGVVLVEEDEQRFALPAGAYGRFEWRHDAVYAVADGGDRVHVTLAAVPIMLGAYPHGGPDAPAWTRAKHGWALFRTADGTDVWAQADATSRGWVVPLASDGHAVLHQAQWRESYLDGFTRPRRWLEWLSHQRPLCDKAAYFLALRWEGAQAGDPVAEAGLTAAYSAWRTQVRARNAR